jgi:hypothetical protein
MNILERERERERERETLDEEMNKNGRHQSFRKELLGINVCHHGILKRKKNTYLNWYIDVSSSVQIGSVANGCTERFLVSDNMVPFNNGNLYTF